MKRTPPDQHYGRAHRDCYQQLERIAAACGLMRTALDRRPAPIGTFRDALRAAAHDLQDAAEHAHDCAELPRTPPAERTNRANFVELMACAAHAAAENHHAAAACLFAAAAGMAGESPAAPGKLLARAQAAQRRAVEMARQENEPSRRRSR